MIEMRAVDVVQPDICYLGGMVRTLRVSCDGEAAGMPITPHSANLTHGDAVHYAPAARHPERRPYLEFSIEGADYYPWQYGLFRNDRPMPSSRTGKVTVTDAPGWGVEIDPAWLERADYQKSEA
jgi:L-alanine-DL-glutamate epimerase-like enolase superfamily enzyme